MKRIKQLHINNFKFFPESQPILLDGKNILLYGENGSGKSSLYWALYTLLECSGKLEPEIQKYFNKLNAQSLVNIHAPADATGVDDSFIKIVMDDDTNFEVSHQNTTINVNNDAKESLLASDFLNYRLLQRSHTVKHSEEIDLFSMFEEGVFGYVQLTDTNWHDELGATIQLRNAGAIYEVVQNGPDKLYPKKNGELGYPQKGAHNAAHTEFIALATRFEQDLGTLIQSINLRVNPIIQDKLKFNITFHLELEKLSPLKLTEVNYNKPIFAVRLKIDDFNGKGPVSKPQSFLNEARLSAIALAIRLAILERRLQDAPVKILVLDDLMISLDMSNRDKIVKLILDEYAWHQTAGGDVGHQTFILTHDRSLFTFIKNDIANLPVSKSSTWKLIEMYADDIDDNDPNSFEKPKIFYEQNDLAIAVKHYKFHDYPASANYLRKYSEEIFCNWLPEYCWKDKESKEKSNNKMPFQNILDNALNVFWPSFGIPCPEYVELRKYLRILLNPLSHADVGTERYKGEIKNVIKIVESIARLNKETELSVIVAGGEKIEIRNTNIGGDLYKGIYELSDSLYKLTNVAGVVSYSRFDGRIIAWEKITPGGIVTNGVFANKPKKSMQENHTDFVNLNALTSPANWMDELYRMDGTKLI